MKSFSRFLRGLAVLLFAGIGCGGAVVDSGTHYAADALKPFVDSGELPGAISIFYENGRQETVCIGWANVERKIPMSLDRMFMQCSQTKGVCGVSLAILLEEGKIALDDPVSKYLPEFKSLRVQVRGTPKTVPAKNVLTIRMVMNHSGGFPFEIPYKCKHGIASKGLRETAREAAANPLLFEPGTQVQYSDTGIDIGAAIVEVVTGQKWEDFLQERIFRPLKMHDATFQPTDEQLARSVSLYQLHARKPATFRADNPLLPLPHHGPGVHPSAGGGLWITAADQLKFYKMLMNFGAGEDGVRILKPETVQKYLASSTLPQQYAGYSMGFAVDKNDGWFGHGGAFFTSAMVNPQKKQLWLLVVQLVGSPTPWDAPLNAAKQKFFAQEVDDAVVSTFTGRTK